MRLPDIKPKSFFWLLVGASLTLNLASWLWMYLRIPQGSYPFILHYNIYFGQDLLGPRYLLFQIPFLGLTVLGVNLLLASSLFEKSRPYAWLVLGATLVIEMVILYASLIVVYVNT
ncbi:MAG: hypothetical protein HYW80_00415 [Parcubacteria group bacterium]|nr:hypothetical protein [Parcubacteria group bacterium]